MNTDSSGRWSSWLSYQSWQRTVLSKLSWQCNDVYGSFMFLLRSMVCTLA